MNRKAIVLSANYGYINQATATIKSVLYHNQNIHFYLINNDVPQEWFNNLNRRVAALHSSISDYKINLEDFSQLASTRNYINLLTYGRLLIPNFVSESRVVYLDSDIIVHGNLDDLFQLDMQNKPLAAVKDVDGWSFNAGVLVIDNDYWKKQDLVSQFFEYGKKQDLPNADQSILNHFFISNYLPLSAKYNYPIGSDYIATYDANLVPGFQQIMKDVTNPVIIHYSSKDKPWNLLSGGRMRDLWWQYADLNWYDLIMHHPLPMTERQPITHLFTFTGSDQLVNIKNLAQRLPQYDFDIAAWTSVSPTLIKLTHFPNVHVYPTIAIPLIDQLIGKAGAYLDISQGPKEEQFMDRFVKTHKPILAFENVCDHHYDDYSRHYQFSDQQWPAFIKTLQQLLVNKGDQ